MRRFALPLALTLASQASPAAAAGAPPLGASNAVVLPPLAPYDLANQTSLSEPERLAWTGVFGRYLDAFVTMGLTTVRVGLSHPDLYSWGAVEPEPSSFRFLVADLLLESITSRGLDPVLPLSSRAAWDHGTDTLLPSDTGRYDDYVRMLVERYDGDSDFGVPPGEEYPDITGDGSVSIADWGASEADKEAWAAAHTVRWWEVARELESQAPDAQLAQLVIRTRAVARAASEDVKLLLGDLALGESKGDFLARIESLRPQVAGAPQVEAFGLALETPGEGLSVLAVLDDAREVFGWLAEAGYGDAELWITSVGAGATVPPEGKTGPCADPRCDDRTQAAQLVKLVVQALEEGPVQVPGGFADKALARVLLREPIELPDGGPTGSWWGGGALRFEGTDPRLEPLFVRPAFATLQRLTDALAGVTPGDVQRIVRLPDTPTRRVYQIDGPGGRSYVAWYNWSEDLGEAPYDGRFLRVELQEVDAPAVRVTTLYPTDVDAVTSEAGVTATFEEVVLPVEEGRVTIDVRQDPVLIEPVTEVVPGDDVGPSTDADAGPTDTAGAAPDASPTADAGGDEGGCTSSGQRPHAAVALVLLVLITLRKYSVKSGRSRWRRC